GDAATLTGFTTSGLKNSDDVTAVTLTSAGTAATAGVGGYAITASSAQGNGLSNYTVSYVGGTLAVTARPIVVTAHSLSRLVGAEDPALTYSVGGRGLVNGDTLLGSLVTAAADAPAGTYAITQGTLAASSNYSLTYNPATLTVTPAVTVEVQPPAPNAGGGGAEPAARTEALEQILPSVVLPRNRVVATASQVAPLSQSREPAMSASSTDSSAAGGVAGSTAATGVSGLAAGSPTTQDATGATAACTGGAASSSACTNAPHPENTRVGRFLHFSMR
ncbi:MBG domain-containing protein, partial [Azospirillum brasilense]|uniref:MBG domain-containing protein n=1 Tax=Azospirillum brasilense TaxID=192 RepID=UPI00196283FF